MKLSHFRNEIGELRQRSVHSLPDGQWTADRHPLPAETANSFSTPQTSPSVETGGAFVMRNPFIAGSPTTGEQPWLAQFSRIFQRGQSGSSQASSTELCTTGDTSLLWTVGPANTTSTTLRLTQQYQMTAVTLSPQRATRTNLCSHQVCIWPVDPRAREEGGRVVGRRWRSHSTSRTHSVSGQYPSPTISTSRTVLRTTGGSGQQVLDLSGVGGRRLSAVSFSVAVTSQRY